MAAAVTSQQRSHAMGGSSSSSSGGGGGSGRQQGGYNVRNSSQGGSWWGGPAGLGTDGSSASSSSSSRGRMSLLEACSLLGLDASGQGLGGMQPRLGVSKAEVGRAFRRQAALCHPDSLKAKLAPTQDDRQPADRGSAAPPPLLSHSAADQAAQFVRLQHAYELVLSATSH